MIIVKLGGSAITDKSTYKKFNYNITENIIKTLHKINKNLIIIHGGGSFGHIKAKEYGLPGPITKDTLEGMTLVHNDMVYLNLKISQLFLENGFANMSIPISTIINGENKNYEAVKRYMDIGVTPVLYGDTYISNNGIGIYSGDDIACDLAKIFNPESVVFFSDIDGIYNKNPKKFKDAMLLKTINGEFQYENNTSDVTGGIMNKYIKMKEIADMNIPVYLLNGYYPDRIYNIGKDNFIGTVVS